MQTPNIQSLERKAGSAAASFLRAVFRTSIKSTFKRRTGAMEKSNVSAKYRDGNLDRLVHTAPHYSFKSHFGSTKTGTTPALSRSGASVKSFSRHINGKTVPVNSFSCVSSVFIGFILTTLKLWNKLLFSDNKNRLLRRNRKISRIQIVVT